METPRQARRRERDVYMASMLNMAYGNINNLLGIEGSLSRTKLANLSILATKHTFTLLQPEGIDRSPRSFGNEEQTLKKAREIGDDFLRVYGGRLWPGRTLDEDRVELFPQSIRNFIVTIFSLTVKSSEVSDDDPGELIEAFRTAEPDDFDIIRPTTFEELAEFIQLKQLPADLDAGGEAVECRNCGEEVANIGTLYVHFPICLANYSVEATTTEPESGEDVSSTPRFVKWPEPPEP